MKDDRHSSGEGASRDSMTSLTLLDRVRRQDSGGWDRLYALYTPLIRWWCSRQGVPGSDVHDLVQDVFVTVLGRVEEFEHGGRRGSFRAWLRQITAYKVLEHGRRRRGEPPAEGGSEARTRLAQVAGVVPAEEDNTERALVVRAAMEQLRGRFAAHNYEAAMRTLVGGEPTDVVAAALGMKPGAVLVAKTRFLHKLRAELGELLD